MKRVYIISLLALFCNDLTSQVILNNLNNQFQSNYNNKVFWADQNTVYSVGQNFDFENQLGGNHTGVIYKSIDNGNNFKLIKTNDNSDFYGVWFNNNNEGFVCGSTEKLRATILKTTDGGTTWKSQVLAGDIRFKDVYFINSKVGFVGGKVIYKTIDGGETWFKVFDDYLGVEKFQFVSENKGYAITRKGVLLRTENQGDTWVRMTIDSDFTPLENPLWSYSMAWTDDKTGIVATEDNGFYKTFNGGATWRKIGINYSGSIQDMKFLTPTIGYAIGSKVTGSLFRTTDAGETWVKVNSIQVPTSQGFAFSYHFALGNGGLNSSAIITGFQTFFKTDNLNPDLDGTKPFAVLQGIGSVCDDSVRIRLDILGDNPPFTVTYEDIAFNKGTIRNITSTPYFFKVKPVNSGLTYYFLRSVTNSLGTTGLVSGRAEITKNAPSKAILRDSKSIICKGDSVTLSIELSGCPPWKLEYSDGQDTFSQSNITNPNYSLRVSPLKSVTYLLKSVTDVNGGVSILVSGSASITIDTLRASIKYDTAVISCYTSNQEIQVNFSGQMPYSLQYKVGDELFTIDSIKNKQTILKVKADTGVFRLHKVSNICGEGLVNGQVKFKLKEYHKFPTNLKFQLLDSIQVLSNNRNNLLIIKWQGGDTSSNTKFQIGNSTFEIKGNKKSEESISYPGSTLGGDQLFRFQYSSYACGTIYSKMDTFKIPYLFKPQILNSEKELFLTSTDIADYKFADINNDGFFDIITSSLSYNTRIFLNDGNGNFTFIDIVEGGDFVNIGDYNNDGLDDLLSSTTLLKNYGNGDFRQVKDWYSRYIVPEMTFSDFDNDGDLDILHVTPPSIYRNDGNDNFTVIELKDSSNNTYYGYPISIDVNNDLKPDLVTPTAILLNYGNMTFKKVTNDIGDIRNFDVSLDNKTSIKDINNDGWDDILMEDYNRGFYAFINQKNNSFKKDDRKFQDLLKYTFKQFGDLDNNGFDDVFADEYPYYNYNNYNFYQSDSTYLRIRNVVPNGIMSDLNNDGALDVVNNGMIYKNLRFSGNNGINIKCVGVQSNRSAIGAKVRIRSRLDGKDFIQHKKITEGVVHFGVGSATKIDTIEVKFPSGRMVVKTNIAPNQLITIVEDIVPSLPTPTPLKVQSYNTKAVELTWRNNSKNYSGIIIERSLNADSGFVKIATLYGNLTTFRDTTVSSKQYYYYRIYAFDKASKSDYSNTEGVRVFYNCHLNATLRTPPITNIQWGEVVTLSATCNEKVSYRWYNLTTQSIMGSDSDTTDTFKVDVFFRENIYAAIVIKNKECIDTTNLITIYGGIPLLHGRNSGLQSGASSWADFDNDGDDDAIISKSGSSSELYLYRNDGNDKFTPISTGITFLKDTFYTGSISLGDYNNDGKFDILTSFSSYRPDTSGNIIFKNKGDGTFEKIIIYATNYISDKQPIIWFDANNDGLLDILSSNSSSAFFSPTQGATYILLNKGNDKFEKSCEMAPSPQNSVGIIDFDNDGLDDVLLLGYDREKIIWELLLYKNKNNGIFEKQFEPVLKKYFSFFNYNTFDSFSINIVDINNDGLFDIYVFKEKQPTEILINKGNGVFEPTLIKGLNLSSKVATCADFDNNGWVDFFSGGNFYMANSSGEFKFSLGYDNILYSTFVDVKNDGFVDLISNKNSNNFGTYDFIGLSPNSNHWLTVKPKTTKSNRLGIGVIALIKVTVNGKKLSMIRQINGLTNYGGQSPQKAYFGVGSTTTIDSLIVKFPSGIVRKFANIPVDQILEVSEDETELPKFALSVEGKDTCMNKVTITLKVANGQAPYKYVWSNGETTPSVSNLSTGIYAVTVTDAANGKVIKEFNVKTCVWPGDTDSSGVVNHFDLLNIGLNYNMVGLNRGVQDQNINWYGHKADIWSRNTINTTINVNHSDSDGDGFVGYKDTSAINLHWEKKHNLKSSNSSSSSTLNVAPPISIETSPVSENKRYSFPIILGDNDNLVSAIYGLGFSIDYDINKINANSINVTFDKCWLGKDILTISKNFEDIGRMEVALVRKNGFNINGKGQIGTLSFTVKNGVSNSSLSFGIKNSKAIDNTNRILILNEKVTSSTITAIGDVNWDSKIIVYPNPVASELNIESNDLEIKQIELFDFRGVSLLNIVSKSLIQTIDMKDFSNSFYILKISTDKGIVMKKVIKTN
jgi:photosystem II stability/assembly factor-like uncharacterized protein